MGNRMQVFNMLTRQVRELHNLTGLFRVLALVLLIGQGLHPAVSYGDRPMLQEVVHSLPQRYEALNAYREILIHYWLQTEAFSRMKMLLLFPPCREVLAHTWLGKETPQLIETFCAFMEEQSRQEALALAFALYWGYRKELDSAVRALHLPGYARVLPIALSLMNPFWKDPFGRTGYWQLSYTVARAGHLQVTGRQDQRRVWRYSTRVALRYLRYLVQQADGDTLWALVWYVGSPLLVRGDWSAVPVPVKLQVIHVLYVWHLYRWNRKRLEQSMFSEGVRTPFPTMHCTPVSDTLALSAIAQALKIPIHALALWNAQYHQWLFPGDTLCLPKLDWQPYYPQLVSASRKLWKATIGTKPRCTQPVLYRVRPGDCLSLIAQRYGVRVRDLMRWNRLHTTTIYPGQILRIYRRCPG